VFDNHGFTFSSWACQIVGNFLMLITFYGFLHGVLGVGVDKMWEKNG
jgi:hypothetical protein